MKFKEIWKVNLKAIDRRITDIYCNQFMLMTDEDITRWNNSNDKVDIYTDYSVDLSGSLLYNTEFFISEVVEKIPVKSLGDILNICKENDVAVDAITSNLSDIGLFVGAEATDLLTTDLKLIKDYRIDNSQQETD